MREIKFRGKCAITGLWAYGFYYPSKGNHIIRDAYDKETIVLKKTVGQYTGLKDKNGKEIYEGDILKDIHGYITEVRYIGAEFKSYCEPIDSGVGLFETEKYEIIGNVFENPDLLQSPNSQSK